MTDKILSIFIDESGDFGRYDLHSPYYIVTMILHDQKIDITENIKKLDEHINHLGYSKHAIHTGPLIRRESIYSNEIIENRKTLFNSLFHFARKIPFHYLCTIIRKSECSDQINMIAKLSRKIADMLHYHLDYFNQFNSIIIYYDNGQIELTKILTSVFTTLFSNVEFRKVNPSDYKLFQIADLVCTIELLSLKTENNSFSRSEHEFFGTPKIFKKNILKYIRTKKL